MERERNISSGTNNAPINVKPEGGGGVGQGVGIWTFSIKKSQIPHPWDKIISQNPDPGQVKVVKCHSNLVAHKRNFPTVGMTYDQNLYPGGITYDQNPYPGDSAHDQNPVVSPTPPPPLGLNIDRCIKCISMEIAFVAS